MSKQFLRIVKECVTEAGKSGLMHFQGQIQADLKASHKELVTFVDHQNEQLIAQRIKEAFPHHKIMG